MFPVFQSVYSVCCNSRQRWFRSSYRYRHSAAVGMKSWISTVRGLVALFLPQAVHADMSSLPMDDVVVGQMIKID